MTTATPAPTVTLRYTPRGAAYQLFLDRSPQLMLSGPAGTGKSRAALEKLHLACTKYPGLRGLMVRKTRKSLSESGMVTYWNHVRHPIEGVQWKPSVQQYQYPNGSIIAVGGLDKPGKVMSSEWDMVYVQEATELDEEDWEAVTTRTSRPGMQSPIPYNQVIGDCNPAQATHWLRLRMDAGRTKELVSIHEDNPLLYDEQGVITPAGVTYMSILDALSGVRYYRLRKGLWVSAEGMVYEDAWDRKRNLIDRFEIPREWPRYISVDFGTRNPCVVQWWARDTDGRIYRYREIYTTRKTIVDVAKQVKEIHQREKEPMPYKVICDHDLGERMLFEEHTGWYTTAAIKDVTVGINAMAERLKTGYMLFLRDSLVERDPALVERKLPTCTEEEIEGYCWDANKERPIKENDHGLDDARYMGAEFDLSPGDVTYGPKLF